MAAQERLELGVVGRHRAAFDAGIACLQLPALRRRMQPEAGVTPQIGGLHRVAVHAQPEVAVAYGGFHA